MTDKKGLTDVTESKQANDILRVVRLVEGTTTPEIRLMTGDVRAVLSALQESQGRLIDTRNTANALRDRADLAERTARNWNERFELTQADLDACRSERLELKLELVRLGQQLAEANERPFAGDSGAEEAASEYRQRAEEAENAVACTEQLLAMEIAKRQQAEAALAACQRSRTLLHLEVAELQAEASGDFVQARAARAAYLAAVEPEVQP